LAGLTLALGTLASPYHLMFCLAITAAISWLKCRSQQVHIPLGDLLRCCAICLLTFGLSTAWLIVPSVREYMTYPYVGGHDPVRFSADLLSVFVPNEANFLSRWASAHYLWSGNEAETAVYTGYIVGGLAVLGCISVQRARPFLFLSLSALVLSLGPYLHVGGSITSTLRLPEGWLELAMPPMRFGGMPVRWSGLVIFGVTVSAAAGLTRISRAGRTGPLIVTVLAVAALVEVWPKPFEMTDWPLARVMDDWSADQSDWAVLDVTAPGRALWHQTRHNHPIVAGYITRTPRHLWTTLEDNQALGHLFLPPITRDPTSPSATSPQAMRDAMQKLNIRFVVIEAARSRLISALQLPLEASVADLAIYRVSSRNDPRPVP
jgi:hypothetical protein